MILDGSLLNYGNGQFTLDIDQNTPSEAYLSPTHTCNDCIEGAISGVMIDQGNGISSAFELEAVNTDTSSVEHTDGFVILRQ